MCQTSNIIESYASALVRYILRFFMPSGVIVIKLSPSLSFQGKKKYHLIKKFTNKHRKEKHTHIYTLSYSLPHTFMKDTIRHSIP